MAIQFFIKIENLNVLLLFIKRLTYTMCALQCLPKELLSLISSLLGASSQMSLSFASKSFTLSNHTHFSDAVVTDAIDNGYTKLFKWLLPISDKIEDYVSEKHTYYYCERAAYSGSLEILKYIHDNSPYCLRSLEVVTDAIRGGHLVILKWLLENGFDKDNVYQYDHRRFLESSNHIPFNEAVKNGHFDIIQFLWESDKFITRGHVDNICGCAARHGRFEILKWLYVNGCKIGPHTLAEAAEGGHLEILEWLRIKGCVWTVNGEAYTYHNACLEAAKHGHIDVLKWLRNPLNADGFEWNVNTLAGAAENGDLDILEWINTEFNGDAPWNENCFAYAVLSLGERSGTDPVKYLDTLKWLRKHGCPWDFNTCAFAAGNGHIEILEWLIIEGCPWNDEIYAHAAQSGHLNILIWLDKNSDILNKNRLSHLKHDMMIQTDNDRINVDRIDVARCAKLAAMHGHLEILKWLYCIDPSECLKELVADVCSRAAEKGWLNMLKWLKEHNCPWTSNACDKAARYGHYEVLEWLHDNGCPCDPDRCNYCRMRSDPLHIFLRSRYKTTSAGSIIH